MPATRAAVDTVVVYAGLAYPERPFGQVIGMWYDGIFDLTYTDEILAEYRDVLLDPEYLAQNENEIEVEEFLTFVDWFGEHGEPSEAPPPRIRDDHDRKWLQGAIGTKADYLVTVDPDFLDDIDLIRDMRALGVRIAPPYIFLREVVRR